MRGRRRTGAWLAWTVAIGVVVVLAIAACGGSSTQQSEPASTGQAQSEESVPTDGSTQEASSNGGGALKKLRASILHYGREATKADTTAAAQSVSAFFLDREQQIWGAACSYLETAMKKRTQQIGGRGDAGCGRGVEALTTTATKAEGESTIVRVNGLRRKGRQGFLIYTTEAGQTNAMLMILEGGKWKLGGVNPTPLFSS